MNLILACIFLVIQQDVPLKAKEEFEIKLDYQIKRRPTAEFAGTSIDPPVIKTEPETPYVVLNVKILKLAAGEEKVVVNSNMRNKLLNKKIKEGSVYKLDLGFSEDMKNKVTANEYEINFLNAEKVTIHKILIQVDRDGYFYVNNEKRGKF